MVVQSVVQKPIHVLGVNVLLQENTRVGHSNMMLKIVLVTVIVFHRIVHLMTHGVCVVMNAMISHCSGTAVIQVGDQHHQNANKLPDDGKIDLP